MKPSNLNARTINHNNKLNNNLGLNVSNYFLDSHYGSIAQFNYYSVLINKIIMLFIAII